jgi:hypothetical protein
LIGDLFTDKVDEVWGPMESLYPRGKQPIPAWNEPPAVGYQSDEPRLRELSLPEGHRP